MILCLKATTCCFYKAYEYKGEAASRSAPAAPRPQEFDCENFPELWNFKMYTVYDVCLKSMDIGKQYLRDL